MAAGCERSVLLMFTALSLFCIFRVCAGQLSLVLTRRGNRITLTCFDNSMDLGQVQVRNAVFYMRVPSEVTRTMVDETGGGLQNLRRVNNGAAITFTITPETAANFTCASPTASENEAPGVLVAAFRPERPAIPDQFLTVFPGETVPLECGIQPGQARELYSVQWLRNDQVLNNQRNFSLSVSVESMSENGTEYHCSVTIRSCSPGCSLSRFVDGPSIILIVGELISITQETDNQEVFVGGRANFTCSARGTDISIFWETGGTEYRDCSTPGFCVTDTTGEDSAESSRFEITTGEDMIGQPISVRS